MSIHPSHNHWFDSQFNFVIFPALVRSVENNSIKKFVFLRFFFKIGLVRKIITYFQNLLVCFLYLIEILE